ncbi:MAG: hypothetical protein HY678_06005 [Chloroflexi bacterium]|nr:hypothetical protein [Chloroflexota bacterium]
MARPNWYSDHPAACRCRSCVGDVRREIPSPRARPANLDKKKLAALKVRYAADQPPEPETDLDEDAAVRTSPEEEATASSTQRTPKPKSRGFIGSITRWLLGEPLR